MTARAEYAMRAMMDLARMGSEVTTASQIAERQCIPLTMMPAIVNALSTAGLVDTARGHRGGVRLAREAGAITVRDIWDAIQGPLALPRCRAGGGDCPLGLGGECPLRDLWERTQQRVIQEWESTSLADLAGASGGVAAAST